MTLLSKQQLENYDCALDGVAYRVAWQINKVLQFAHAGYIEEATDIVVEKSDTSVEQMTENKVDKLYWESQRSWHAGAGQRRYDDPKNSDPGAFLLSQGVDVRIPGQATLAPDITNQHTANISTGDAEGEPSKLAVAANIVFREDSGGAGLRGRFRGITLPTTDAGSPTVKTFYSTPSSTDIIVADVASDGQNLYFAVNDGTNTITTIAGSAADGTHASAYATGSPAFISIAWVKNQLVGYSFGTNGIYAIASGASASKLLLTLPAGWSVPRNCITEIAGFVLFGAVSNMQSVVYAWDGNTTPYICSVLPDGDRITAMSSYLGVEVLIGCSRAKSTQSFSNVYVGTGVLYVAQAAAAAQLILKEIVEIGDNGVPWPIASTVDNKEYGIFGLVNRGRYSYFSWQPFGLGCYDHTNQSYSRYLGNLGANAGSLLNGGTPGAPNFAFGPLLISSDIGDVVVCARRLCFATSSSTSQGIPFNNGLFVENLSTLVASGQILGSVMDWNIDKPKSVNQAELGTLPLPVGTSASLSFSLDGGATSVTVGTLSGTGNTAFTSSATLNPPGNFFQTTNTINYLVTLTPDLTLTLTPILKKVGFGAWYGSKPTFEWKVYIDCSDRLTAKRGEPYVLTGAGSQILGPDPQLGDKIVAKFRALRNSQAVVDWQPPVWGDIRQDTYKVQVRGYDYYRWNEPGVGPGGAVVQVTLKQAP